MIIFAPVKGKRFLKHRGVAQLASALAWGARGRKFESSHPDETGKGPSALAEGLFSFGGAGLPAKALNEKTLKQALAC